MTDNGGARGLVLVVEGATHALPSTGEVVIGRSPDADLVLEWPTVSRRHARLIVTDGEVVVEDLGSHNGLRLNGEPISGRARLVAGDRLTIGDRELGVAHADSSQAPTQPPPAKEGAASDATAPITVSPRSLLEQGTEALDEGRLVEAERTLGACAMAFELQTSLGRPDKRVLVEATIAFIYLCDATGNAAVLERLLRLRRIAGEPLDVQTTLELARSFTELAETDDVERRQYCVWAQSQPMSFTERSALKKLADTTR